MIKINICGDVVPTSLNEELFKNGDVINLVGEEIFSLLKNSDLNIVNLECPLTDSNHKIHKNGPNLKADKNTIKGIKDLNIHVCSLANNHIKDYDVEGINDTIEVLKDNNISYLGVGNNIFEARKPLIKEINGYKIGIYSCAEHEFSLASESEGGANPIDLINVNNDIKYLKSNCDYLICLYHGGKELYCYPSPNLKKVCHYLIKSGADMVICQHSHCIGSKEDYEGGVIIYGCGNFLFASEDDKDLLLNSLIVHLEIDDNKQLKIDYLPIRRYQKGCLLANKKDKEKILSSFNERSLISKDDDKLLSLYNTYSLKRIYSYLESVSGIGKKNIIYRIINKLSGHRLTKIYVKHRYHKEQLLSLLNVLECEAHLEVLTTGIKELLKEK